MTTREGMSPYDHARQHGADRGRSAAEEWANAVLMGAVPLAEPDHRGIAVALEHPRPDLSGEWAGGITGPLLMEHVEPPYPYVADFSQVCAEYEDGFTEAVEAVAREYGIEIGEEVDA